jgi:Rrf2 family protein
LTEVRISIITILTIVIVGIMISMRSKYALKALGFMARSKEKEIFLISDLAEEENIPRKFLEAILLTLKSQGILASRKGPGGDTGLQRHLQSLPLAVSSELLKVTLHR